MILARLAGAFAWLLAATGAAALGWSAVARVDTAPPPPAAEEPAGGGGGPTVPEAAESLERVVVVGDLFRSDRRPATVAYNPTTPAPAAAASAPARPALTLTGLVWGAVPEAVLAGLPGTNSPRVLRMGDVVGGFRLARLTPTIAVIVGADTAWTLTLRNPWP